MASSMASRPAMRRMNSPLRLACETVQKKTTIIVTSSTKLLTRLRLKKLAFGATLASALSSEVLPLTYLTLKEYPSPGLKPGKRAGISAWKACRAASRFQAQKGSSTSEARLEAAGNSAAFTQSLPAEA